jgi:hypothetical protein
VRVAVVVVVRESNGAVHMWNVDHVDGIYSFFITARTQLVELKVVGSMING